jgi:hypothetical protein
VCEEKLVDSIVEMTRRKHLRFLVMSLRAFKVTRMHLIEALSHEGDELEKGNCSN